MPLKSMGPLSALRRTGWAWCLAVVLAAPAAAADLVINSGRKEPFTTPDGQGFYDRLVPAWFARLGLTARCVRLPSERALINANAGIDDGNIARIKGLEKKYPNLVRVPEAVVTFDFMAFSRVGEFPVQGWESLAPYDVGYITGWKILEKNITRARSITRVRGPVQLFELLARGRADVVVFDRWGGLWRLRHGDVRARMVEPPLATRQLYLYLNRRHAALVPKLAEALRAMKADGSYARIHAETLDVLVQD